VHCHRGRAMPTLHSACVSTLSQLVQAKLQLKILNVKEQVCLFRRRTLSKYECHMFRRWTEKW